MEARHGRCEPVSVRAKYTAVGVVAPAIHGSASSSWLPSAGTVVGAPKSGVPATRLAIAISREPSGPWLTSMNAPFGETTGDQSSSTVDALAGCAFVAAVLVRSAR